MKIYLDKRDLLERFRDLPIEEVWLEHIANKICSSDTMKKARFISYHDNGKMKILKDLKEYKRGAIVYEK